VAELVDGKPVPFPDASWNSWDGKGKPWGFACVQSVLVDDEDFLWVLDPANPLFRGVLPQGPVLYRFRISDRTLAATYRFPRGSFVGSSYLNDVRVDTRRKVAYLTDSGAGAIVVLDLATGRARRLLADAAATQAQRTAIFVGGRSWHAVVHADGVALDPAGEWLWFAALTGDDLFRVATSDLLDASLPRAELEARVKLVRRVGPTDGMLFGRNGRLYLGGLESSAVLELAPPDRLRTVVADPRIRWADSFAEDSAGNLYFTTSQIHLPPSERGPYELWRIDAEFLR
jgi:sugar lactone lactonase YvrE